MPGASQLASAMKLGQGVAGLWHRFGEHGRSSIATSGKLSAARKLGFSVAEVQAFRVVGRCPTEVQSRRGTERLRDAAGSPSEDRPAGGPAVASGVRGV